MISNIMAPESQITYHRDDEALRVLGIIQDRQDYQQSDINELSESLANVANALGFSLDDINAVFNNVTVGGTITLKDESFDNATIRNDSGNIAYTALGHVFSGPISTSGDVTATGDVTGSNISTMNNSISTNTSNISTNTSNIATKAPTHDPTFTGTLSGDYITGSGMLTIQNGGGPLPTYFNYNVGGTNYIRGNTEFGNGFKGGEWYSNTSQFPLGSGTWQRLAWINNGVNIYYQGSSPAFNGPLATSTGAPSDRRIKKNISSLEVDALDLLDKLTVKKYDIGFPTEKDISDPSLMDGVFTRREIGLIAQDVLAIPEFSDFVTEPQNNRDFYKLRYNNFFTLSIKAIQELNTKCNNLQTENTQLKADLDALVARVTTLEP